MRCLVRVRGEKKDLGSFLECGQVELLPARADRSLVELERWKVVQPDGFGGGSRGVEGVEALIRRD